MAKTFKPGDRVVTNRDITEAMLLEGHSRAVVVPSGTALQVLKVDEEDKTTGLTVFAENADLCYWFNPDWLDSVFATPPGTVLALAVAPVGGQFVVTLGNGDVHTLPSVASIAELVKGEMFLLGYTDADATPDGIAAAEEIEHE